MIAAINHRSCWTFSHLFYSTVVFISLYTYFFPLSIPGIPVTTDRILQVIGIAYVVFIKAGKMPKSLVRYLLYSIFVLIIFTGVLLINTSMDDQVLKQALSYILYVFGAIFIVSYIKKISSEDVFRSLLKWIIIVACIQAVISLFLFFNKDLQASVIEIIGGTEAERMQHFGAVRLIALAKGQMQYGNMAVFYGTVTFIALIYNKLYPSKIIRFIIPLFVIAGILSARSYLLIFGWGIMFLFILNSYKIGILKSTFIIIVSLIAVVLSMLILMYYLENSEYESTYKWAFEIFINFSENGQFGTDSTSDMQTMYIFPEYLSTWLLGDGYLANPDGTFYMHTDIGYLRYLYCCGLIGSMIIYYIQIKYCCIGVSLTNNHLYKCIFIFILTWTFIYLFKEIYSVVQWCTLLTAALCVEKCSPNKLVYG